MKQEVQMYITNLLCETLPSSHRKNENLWELGLAKEGTYIALQLFLSKELQRQINEKNDEDAILWKKGFHEKISSSFTSSDLEVVGLLNLQPMVRTLVIRYTGNNLNNRKTKEGRKGFEVREYSEVYSALDGAFSKLHQCLLLNYCGSVTGGFGTVVETFFDIGRSYKKARELYNYRYTIGVGKCTFFDLFPINEKDNLIEYKYLRHFEQLLENKDWLSLFDLLGTIKENLITERFKDSKISYIYKEIFSVTIRHLFENLDANKEWVRRLNKGITMFEAMFDDLEDIHLYCLDIFSEISEVSLYDTMHPLVKKAIKIIQNDYNKTLSLDTMSEALGISTAYFSRLFKVEAGSNFKVYLTKYRVEKAKKLLATTNYSITHIREAVGYQTPTQFVRVFKANEGITPSKYRQYVKKKS